MALTAAQIEARNGKLTASRVACLMTGDAAKIMDLWREMTGDPSFVQEDLTWDWNVQRGNAMEPLILDFYEHDNRQTVSRRGEVVVHPRYDWIASTLDGWIDDLSCPIEAKSVNGNEHIDIVINRYFPQTTWQMVTTNSTQCCLAVSEAGRKPVREWIALDHDYAAEMMKRGHQFMAHVRNRTPPVVLPEIIPPGDRVKVCSMEGNNLWASLAADFLAHREGAQKFEAAKDGIKELMPADAKRVHGHGIDAMVDRAGRRHVKESKK